MRLCVTNYYNDPINCVSSAQGQFIVTDPCLNTVILIENPIGADELSTYQNGIDSLQDYLNLVNFPDTESIRIE